MASMTNNILRKLFLIKKEDDIDVDENKENNRLDGLMDKFERILIWDNPLLSFVCLVGINILFWLLVSYECKLYGFIFTILLTVIMYELWRDRTTVKQETSTEFRFFGSTKTPDQPAQNENLSEFKNYLQQVQRISRSVCVKMRQLREEQPGTFCVVTCISFLLLSIIGRSISGITLAYTLVMSVMTVPGLLFHFVPKQSWTRLFHTASSQNSCDNDMDDLLPDTSVEALHLLKMASDLQLPIRELEDDEESNDAFLEQISSRTNDTAGSSGSKLSFCPDLELMPSHDNSLDCYEIGLPSQSQFESLNLKKSDSDDSSEPGEEQIHFKSSHFNGDSSEEDVSEFAKGLQFTETDSRQQLHTTQTEEPSLAATVSRNIISVGATILSSVLSKQQQEQQQAPRTADKKLAHRKDSDSDSFELISDDEVEKLAK